MGTHSKIKKSGESVTYTEIKVKRQEFDISQTKLAEYSGYSRALISAWELGKQIPDASQLKNLNDVMNYLVIKIRSGELNLKKKKIRSGNIKKKTLPKTIKNAEEYRMLSNSMNYESEYSLELKHMYLEATKGKKRGLFKGIALFSGCGGMTLGFEAAGIDVVGHVEIEDSANKIYAANFPQSTLLGKDVCEIKDKDIATWKERFGSIDVIIGGPPCQGFSLAGKRNPEDERNKLYKQYVRIVSQIEPKVFVMENVALMTSMKDSNGRLFIDKIKDEFSKAGYKTIVRTVNAYEYGVPQSRERVIIVGIRQDIDVDFQFPEAEYSMPRQDEQCEIAFDRKKAVRTFRYATADTAKLESGEWSKTDPLHWAISHPDHVIDWLKNVPEGHSAHENPDPELRPPSGFNTTYKRIMWDEPSSTISTNFSMISGCRNVHPQNTRSLTIREAARVQSFPDEFVFCGNWGDIRKAIGNAVPPLLALKIAKEIKEQVLKKGK